MKKISQKSYENFHHHCVWAKVRVVFCHKKLSGLGLGHFMRALWSRHSFYYLHNATEKIAFLASICSTYLNEYDLKKIFLR